MPRMKEDSGIEDLFATMAGKISQAAGSFWTFSAAFAVVLAWAATGPIFNYSETWQLVINTGTTIVTFLMVFVIQHAQNKDMRAVQLKLNELIAAVEGASNRLIDVEDLSDRELEHLYARFQNLAEAAQKLSHGAKLTIDSSDPDGDPNAHAQPEPPHDHAESAADKKPVSVKPEAQQRKKPRDS
jgi:low affinity Fe/Cu permease